MFDSLYDWLAKPSRKFSIRDLAFREMSHLMDTYPKSAHGFQYGILQQILEQDPLIYLISTALNGDNHRLHAIPQSAAINKAKTQAVEFVSISSGDCCVKLVDQTKQLSLRFYPTLMSLDEIETLRLFPGSGDVLSKLLEYRNNTRYYPYIIRNGTENLEPEECSSYCEFGEVTPLGGAILGIRSWDDDMVKAELRILFATEHGATADNTVEYILCWRAKVDQEIRMRHRIWTSEEGSEKFPGTPF
ncbi:hypothetical protein BDW74DRAFT_158897 [Aspergillus multicolor]|uniref:uncharacterized protein n=1 Tax=Aspergillus multicolor TaxID=41759 RepID=UPI003CCCBACA